MRCSILTNGIAALTLGFVAATSAPAQDVKPPAPGPLRPYVFPRVEQFQLSNGLKVVVVEKHTLPMIEGRLIIDAGSMREPGSKNGLASLAGRLLSEGTGDLTGAEFSRRMEAMGAQYSAGANFNMSFADVVALKNVFPDALALAAQSVIVPSFPENEFGRVKNQALAAYQQRRAQPSALASDAFITAAFDSAAPFSRPAGGTTATISGLTRNDVVEWHRAMFAPSAATLLLVGDITPGEARAVSQKAFGSWTASRAAMGPVANPMRTYQSSRIIIVDRPGSVQSSLMVGHPGFQATDPDYIAMLALNHVFGGQSSARLNTNLREKRGYTYGASSGFDLRPGAGTFGFSSDVRTDATDSALVEAIGEYRRIATDSIPSPELQRAVSNLVSSFPNAVQSVQGLMVRLQNLVVWGLPMDFYATYRERLAGVTSEEVRRAATTRLVPDRLIIVIAGDASKVEAPIRARNLGQVEVWDANGNKLR